MLCVLFGCIYQVMIVVVLVVVGCYDSVLVVLEVSFIDIDDDVIVVYVVSGELMGKVGVYVIQGGVE